MTMSVVTGNAIAEPENLSDAQVIAQALLDLRARKIRIPILFQRQDSLVGNAPLPFTPIEPPSRIMWDKKPAASEFRRGASARLHREQTAGNCFPMHCNPMSIRSRRSSANPIG